MACKICYNPSCNGKCVSSSPFKMKGLPSICPEESTKFKEKLSPLSPLDCKDKTCKDEVTRQITIVNNNTSGGGGEPIDLEHNNLINIQGGNLLERYHLDKKVYDSLQGKNLSDSNKVVSQTDIDNLKVSSNLSLGEVNEYTVTIDNDGGTGVTLPNSTPTSAGVMTSYDKVKIDGIEQGAQKNVQSDWEATAGDAFIKNKPLEFPPTPHTHNIPDVNGLQLALDLKEDKSNKSTSLNSPNNTTYPTTLAVVNALQNLNSPVTSVNGKIGDVVITKTDIGLGNVDNTSDSDKPISNATQAVLDNKIDEGDKGSPNGVASLDGNGVIPVEQLPPHTHIPSDINIGQNLFLVGDVNGKGEARNILPSDVSISVPNGVAISSSTGGNTWQIRQADANPTALTIPLRSSTGRLKVGDATEFNDAITLKQLQDGLLTKVNTSTTITGNGGVVIGGSLESGNVSIGVNDVYFNNKYIKKDADDNNGTNKLTLGELETPKATLNELNLPSLGSGAGTDELLVIDPTGVVKKKSAVSDVAIKVGNSAGTTQFTLGATSPFLFEGGGDTSISFNPSTNKVTITSIAGSGTGGAVTSFNGRTGGVVSEVGDYSTTQVVEGDNLYFTESRVRATTLTGLDITNSSPLTLNDSVLQGLGKLQAQTNLKTPSSRNLTVSGTAGRILASGGTQNLSLDREWILDLAPSGVSAGTFNKVVVDSYGRVINGGGLTVSDIPLLPYKPESYIPTWTEVTGKPTFATVATSGNYNDLINKPTIPDVSNFAFKDGLNATGTWPISITGDATSWGGNIYGGSGHSNQNLSLGMGYNSVTNTWSYYSAQSWRQWLGSPADGETLQSVVDRGNKYSAPTPYFRFEKSGILNWYFGNMPSYGNDFAIYADNAPGAPFVIKSGSGAVGIGTVNPEAPFDVSGQAVIGSHAVNSNNTKLFLRNTSGTTWALSAGTNGSSENNFAIYKSSDFVTPMFVLSPTGDISITGSISVSGGNSTQWNQAYSDRVTTNTQQTITANKTFTNGLSTKNPTAGNVVGYYSENHDGTQYARFNSSMGVNFVRGNNFTYVSPSVDGSGIVLQTPTGTGQTASSKISINSGAYQTTARTVEIDGRASYHADATLLDNLIGTLENRDLVPKKYVDSKSSAAVYSFTKTTNAFSAISISRDELGVTGIENVMYQVESITEGATVRNGIPIYYNTNYNTGSSDAVYLQVLDYTSGTGTTGANFVGSGKSITFKIRVIKYK